MPIKAQKFAYGDIGSQCTYNEIILDINDKVNKDSVQSFSKTVGDREKVCVGIDYITCLSEMG